MKDKITVPVEVKQSFRRKNGLLNVPEAAKKLGFDLESFVSLANAGVFPLPNIQTVFDEFCYKAETIEELKAQIIKEVESPPPIDLDDLDPIEDGRKNNRRGGKKPRRKAA